VNNGSRAAVLVILASCLWWGESLPAMIVAAFALWSFSTSGRLKTRRVGFGSVSAGLTPTSRSAALSGCISCSR
jgi:hypothetical protein